MPKRPPKEFMDAAVAGIASSGTAKDPAAVATATWAKMTTKARRPWNALAKLREAGTVKVVSTNPHPSVLPLPPQAALPLAAAGQIAGAGTGDLAILRGTFPIPALDPDAPDHMVDVEVHINPMSIGVGAAAVAIGAFFAFGRVDGPWGPLYEGPLADQFDDIKAKRAANRDPAMAQNCAILESRFGTLRSVDGFFFDLTGARRLAARAFWDEAQSRGCGWTQSTPRP